MIIIGLDEVESWYMINKIGDLSERKLFLNFEVSNLDRDVTFGVECFLFFDSI